MITKKDVQIVLQSQTKEATYVVISTLKKLESPTWESSVTKGELKIINLVNEKGIKETVRLLRNSFAEEIFEDTDKIYEKLTKNKKQ